MIRLPWPLRLLQRPEPATEARCRSCDRPVAEGTRTEDAALDVLAAGRGETWECPCGVVSRWDLGTPPLLLAARRRRGGRRP